MIEKSVFSYGIRGNRGNRLYNAIAAKLKTVNDGFRLSRIDDGSAMKERDDVGEGRGSR